MSRITTSPDTTCTWMSTGSSQPVFEKSIFRSHQLRATDLGINQVRETQPDWVLGVLMGCFILFAWAQVFYARRIRQVFRAPFSKRFINQLTRDGNLFRERISVVMGSIYILTFALFLYEFNEQIFGYSIHGITGVSLYWLITGVIIVSLAVKVILVRFLGAIFKTRETTNNYLLNLLIFALLAGPLFLVALVFIVYLKSALLLYLCLAGYVILLVFRFTRGFFIGMELRKFSYLFLFVYLCSLEILPLLVLVKVLLDHAQPAGA
jgi:hypothetical protein